jgi:hypothetical protein
VWARVRGRGGWNYKFVNAGLLSVLVWVSYFQGSQWKKKREGGREREGKSVSTPEEPTCPHQPPHRFFLHQQNLFRYVSENSLLLCAVVALHVSEVSTGAVLVKEVEGLILDGSWGHAEVSKGEVGAIVNENVVFDHPIQDVAIHDWCGRSKLPGEQRSVDHEGWAGDQISDKLHNLAVGIHIRTGKLESATTEFMAILEQKIGEGQRGEGGREKGAHHHDQMNCGGHVADIDWLDFVDSMIQHRDEGSVLQSQGDTI